MKYNWKRRIFSFIIAIGCGAAYAGSFVLPAHAEVIDYRARAESYKLLPIESNQIPEWPQGPAVSAKAAILIEANTGTVLYAKNIHDRLYPASVTKILTAYVARQKSSLNESVVYSDKAVHSINWREDSNIGIKPGEAITMEQSLYGLLVGSGNECGNAIGEHISGSIEAFVALMNETAEELGCTDSNFVTTNGIHDDEHYTSAHDLALIAQKFFDDELLCKMSSTASYVIPPCPTVSAEMVPNSKNLLLPGKKYAYEYLVGSKTGYTALARQNLVSCAQKDGLKLICVVMEDESPMQFTDTIDLFNYGFSNFRAVNVSENDTKYTVEGNSFFRTDNDIFGDSQPFLSIDKNAYIVLPSNADLQDADSSLSYDAASEGQAAVISYTFSGQPAGSAAILFSEKQASFDFNKEPSAEAPAVSADDAPVTAKGALNAAGENNIIFLNVKKAALIIGAVAGLLIILLTIRSVIHSRNLSKRRKAIMKRRRERKDEVIDYDRYSDPF